MESKNIFDHIHTGLMEYFLNSDMANIEIHSSSSSMTDEELKEKRLKLVNRIRFTAQAKLNQYSDTNLLEKAISKLHQIFKENSERPISLLKQHIQNRGIAFQFRNLDKLDVNDIREILNELDLVQLMEDLEKEDDGEKD